MRARSILRAFGCFTLLSSGTLTFAAENRAIDAGTNNQANSLLATKATHEQRIADIEQQHDAYNSELGEAYYALGSTLQALGEDEAANSALRKSLQAIRTSFGLVSLKQLPTLQALTVSSRTLAKWDEVDALHSLIYHITTRQLEAGNDTRVQAAVQLGRWKQEAASKTLLPQREEPAATAITILQKEIGYLKAAKGPDNKNQSLASLYLEVAGAELLEAKRIYDSPLQDYDSNGVKETALEQQCEMVRGADGRYTRVCTVNEVPNTGEYLTAKAQNKTYAMTMHIFQAKDAVNNSLQALQGLRPNAPVHRELRERAGVLITQYNDFVRAAAEQTGSRISR